MKITHFLNFLIPFYLIWLIILQSSLSQEYIKIKLKIIFPNITVLQGSTTDTAFKAENLYVEPLVVDYKFEKPSGLNITTRPEKWSKEIVPNESATIHLTIYADKDLKNDTYTIKVWAEALEMMGDYHIQSEKYPINVTVLYNPILHTTTTTTSTTTTTTTTLLTDRIREMFSEKEKLGILIVAILVILILIPYLSFREGEIETVETTEKNTDRVEGCASQRQNAGWCVLLLRQEYLFIKFLLAQALLPL